MTHISITEGLFSTKMLQFQPSLAGQLKNPVRTMRVASLRASFWLPRSPPLLRRWRGGAVSRDPFCPGLCGNFVGRQLPALPGKARACKKRKRVREQWCNLGSGMQAWHLKFLEKLQLEFEQRTEFQRFFLQSEERQQTVPRAKHTDWTTKTVSFVIC